MPFKEYPLQNWKVDTLIPLGVSLDIGADLSGLTLYHVYIALRSAVDRLLIDLQQTKFGYCLINYIFSFLHSPTCYCNKSS